MSIHIRWEVWVDDAWSKWPYQNGFRFNSCFDKRHQAEEECAWYERHGYQVTDIRMRTTRFQRREHVTTG